MTQLMKTQAAELVAGYVINGVAPLPNHSVSFSPVSVIHVATNLS
jgi:hypothetical protein